MPHGTSLANFLGTDFAEVLPGGGSTARCSRLQQPWQLSRRKVPHTHLKRSQDRLQRPLAWPRHATGNSESPQHKSDGSIRH